MRIRTVKPEWLDDEKIAGASDEARVLSIALILMSDDYGRGRASIATIAATTWRYQMEKDDGAHAPEILARASRAFRECLAIGFVEAYEVNGQRYFSIRNWSRHQRVDKKGKPHVPAPIEPKNTDKEAHLRDPRETLATPSRDTPETLAPDLDPDLDPDPYLEQGEEEVVSSAPEQSPREKLKASVVILTETGPRTPEAAWRLVSTLSDLYPILDPGMPSPANLKRLTAILERADSIASKHGGVTAMGVVAEEWRAMQRLAESGDRSPKVPMIYFHSRFGTFAQEAQEVQAGAA